jgi:general transcription factor 3C polypeptide 6
MHETLFPGYTHVSAFTDDTEYESGEEVSYLTLDIGNVEPTLVPRSDVYRLIVSGYLCSS